MTDSQVERDVLSKLSHKGRIGGRNPIRSLTGMLDHKAADIREAVDRLAHDGRLHVSRRDNNHISEIVHPSPRQHVDRTEMSPQAKRERTYAKDVPAYLPDSMCGPVIVTQGEPRKKKSTTTRSEEKMARSEDDFVYDSTVPYHESLTMCLSLIRQNANDEGEGSGMTELLKATGMSGGQASKAMDYLRGMGLYTSWMSGFQVRSYLVDMSVSEVTEQMVAEYRQEVKAKAKARAEQKASEEIDVEAEVEAAIELVQGVDPEPAIEAEAAISVDLDPIGELVAIVESLETEVSSLRRQLAEVGGERDELRAEVVSLQEKLDVNPLQDARLQQILRRHQR